MSQTKSLDEITKDISDNNASIESMKEIVRYGGIAGSLFAIAFIAIGDLVNNKLLMEFGLGILVIAAIGMLVILFYINKLKNDSKDEIASITPTPTHPPHWMNPDVGNLPTTQPNPSSTPGVTPSVTPGVTPSNQPTPTANA